MSDLFISADWFQSHYYFERFGGTRKEEKGEGDGRSSFVGTEEDKQRVSNGVLIVVHGSWIISDN